MTDQAQAELILEQSRSGYTILVRNLLIICLGYTLCSSHITVYNGRWINEGLKIAYDREIIPNENTGLNIDNIKAQL